MPKTYIPFLFKEEKSLAKSLGIKERTKFPIIAISGLTGSGKNTYTSSLQKLLNERLGLKLKAYQGGDILREQARKAGYTEKHLEKFAKVAGKNIDYMIEKGFFEKGLKEGGIFSGRLTFATFGNWAVKIWINIQPETAAQRFTRDKNRPEYGLPIRQIVKGIKERNKADIGRYEKLYKINYDNLNRKVNLAIDNSLEGAQEQISECMYSYVKGYLASKKYI